MLQLPDDRRPPITPQLAVRVAIFGGVAVVLFAVVFFRLWYLQVLSGDKYLAQANDNRVRDITVEAPRGDIVDRNGAMLVDNRVATVVQLDLTKIPPPGPRREGLYRRLRAVIGITPAGIRQQIRVARIRVGPFANVTLKTDATRAQYSYIFERQDEFPGVTVQRAYLRQYPHDELAAQLLGTVGQVSPAEIKQPKFRGVKPGTIVGQGGVEYSYDRYLRGRPGATRVQVDASGRPKGELAVREPVQGKQLKLSIDVGLEKAGQDAMASAGGIPIVNGVQDRGGAFVAMNPDTGEVYAMGSYPSYDPNVFAKPVKESVYRKLNSALSGSPLFDRSIQGRYPTGSTFKAITATAALQSGTITPDTPFNDAGSIKIGDQTFKNAGGVANGTLSLRDAIKVSSDVFFYHLGALLNSDRPHGGTLQKWAHRLGIGRRTGIDLPGESPGLLPTPAWRARRGAEEARCRKRRHVSSCGISDERPWSVGDNVNLAVGQGDLQADPIQLATAYSALVNVYRHGGDGEVVVPHVGMEVEDSAGRVLQRIQPGAARRLKLPMSTVSPIMDGLRLAASAPGGTSADVFAGFPFEVYGKTGTAERPPHGDQSWYVAYATDHGRRPIVVAVTIEQGGFGAQTAAPAARLILSQWFGVKKQIIKGSSHTR